MDFLIRDRPTPERRKNVARAALAAVAAVTAAVPVGVAVYPFGSVRASKRVVADASGAADVAATEK